MRPKQLFTVAVVIFALAGACTNTRKEAPTAMPPEAVKRIVEEMQTHPDRWTKYRDDLIRQYKRLGYDVAIDSTDEFQTLFIGFYMFTVPVPDDMKIPFTPDQQKEAFADFMRLNNNLPLPFSPEAWKAAEGDYRDSLRYRMFKGFQRKYKVIGMPAAELVKKLGPPLWESPDEIAFEMDLGPGLSSMDNMSLHFNISSGTVTGFRFGQN